MTGRRHVIPEMDEVRTQFAQLAEAESAGAPTPAGGRWWRRRRALLAIPALAFGAGAVATATTLISTGEPVRDIVGLPAEIAPGPGGARIVVTAADEEAKATWGVSVYRSREGESCAIAGQVRGTRLGLVQRGTFRPYLPTRPGPCRDLTPGRVISGLLNVPGPPVRTLAFGRAAADVTRVDLVAGDDTFEAKPGPGGAFLFVLEGRVLSREIRLTPVVP